MFLQDNHIDEDKQWRLMLDYFKKNPDALMDAIPTPPGGDEDEKALADFRTGLTPKRGKAFKFGGDKHINRPNYDEDQRQSLSQWRSTSQMSSRSQRAKVYEQSPRVGSARSNRSNLSRTSSSQQLDKMRYNQSSARKDRLNRSYSSNMGR